MSELLYLIFLQWPAELIAGLFLMGFSIGALAAPIYAGIFVYEFAMERWPRWASLALGIAGGVYVLFLLVVAKDTIAVALLHFASGDD